MPDPGNNTADALERSISSLTTYLAGLEAACLALREAIARLQAQLAALKAEG